MSYLEDYWGLIQRKEVVVGYWIRQAVKNLVNDLDDPRYIYDTEEANKRFRFEESLCLQSKAPYYMKPIQLMPWQKAWWEAVYSFKMADTGLRRFTEGLLEIARKNGKALALNTRIPTPIGDKTIADIKPGDYVFGADGLPKLVYSVSEVFKNHDCYEIEFEDGEKLIADAGHIWRVYEKISHGKAYVDKTTEQLVRDYARFRHDGKGMEYKYRVEIPKAVEYPEKYLLIDPYVLGVWLGDGMTKGTRIAVGKEDVQTLTDQLKRRGANPFPAYYPNGKINIAPYKTESGKRSHFTKGLVFYNLHNEKHIPEEYFYSSVEQRKELLKGLMDTDGTVSKAGQCEFVQKEKRLTDDLSRLLSSLGIKHSVKEKMATCKGKKIPVFRILFYVDKANSCFCFERKTQRLKAHLAERMNAKSIVRIIKVQTVETKCLCVEGGLYLCGNRNTVTHNSTSFAADGNYELFMGEGGTDICCASNDDRQAKLIWLEIGGMRSRLDPKKAVTGQNLTEIKNRRKNITVFRLSSKTQNKDGFNISKTYLDESHDIAEENGQSEIAEACWRGMSSKEEPLFLNCTTQGFNRDCYLDHKISYAKKVISGEIDDEHFIAFLYEQDSEQEIWQDESSWEKSNPSIRYGVKKIAKLRRDVEAAKYDKATRIHMLTKDFNVPQSNAQSWLMLEDYDYPMQEFSPEDFRGALVLGAVDLSATTDLSSAKILLMRPEDKTKYILSHYWIPESKLESADDKEAGAAYQEWAKAGLLTIDEGNEINISAIADWFYQLNREFGFRPYKIGYDQRFAKTFIERCAEYGFETEMLAQGRALSNAMKLVEADLKSRFINFNQNAIDKWCLANCCCAVDNVGNIQPVKIPGQQSKRIDGALTFIMLYEVYRRYKTDFKMVLGGG